MNNVLGKWKQSCLLQQNSLTSESIPETSLYSVDNLLDYISRYEEVYVKHDSSGQGRAIFKVNRNNEGLYCLNGFTIQGVKINRCVPTIEDLHQVFHPFVKFGRLSGNYIIQEYVQSVTFNQQPFCIRVHIQNLNGNWIIGGIYGKTGKPGARENGIVNARRGAQVMSIEELLMVHCMMDEQKKNDVIRSLEEMAFLAADVIASYYPCREYGIDFGLIGDRKPVIFEVNSTPGIGAFANIENNTLWKRIVEIRKLQKK